MGRRAGRRRRESGHPVCAVIQPSASVSALVRSPAVRSESGFTLIEIVIVMFVFLAMLGIVVPRINLDDDLASAGRKFITVLRTLQGIAMSTQKPVKLYLDLDQGKYWPMTYEGKEEKLLLDAAWATPRTLPESIRLADASSGTTKRTSGRFDLTLYPNGRIDGVVMHLTDTHSNVLGIVVESATGAIRTSDERIEPKRAAPIPDRVKQLLMPAAVGGGGSALGQLKP